jgi:hypothetical protein
MVAGGWHESGSDTLKSRRLPRIKRSGSTATKSIVRADEVIE